MAILVGTAFYSVSREVRTFVKPPWCGTIYTPRVADTQSYLAFLLVRIPLQGGFAKGTELNKEPQNLTAYSGHMHALSI